MFCLDAQLKVRFCFCVFCFALNFYSDIGISLFSFRFGLKAALVALVPSGVYVMCSLYGSCFAFRLQIQLIEEGGKLTVIACVAF